MSNMNRWKRIRDWYVRFAEGKGFAVTLTLCVAVITASAVWTAKEDAGVPSPTPPVGRELSAAALKQESLRDAQIARPTATPAPLQWTSPVKAGTIVAPFSLSNFSRAAATGIWQLHPGADLSAEKGSRILAPADGRVSAAGKDAYGLWIAISHTGGYETRIAGLSMIAALREGDKVRGGQVIGYASGSTACGQQMHPCIHAETTLHGKAVDPAALFGMAQ